jgi:NAD(P)-dependent dehydrogenase (short-subunit alcohol dehydrogenase family)
MTKRVVLTGASGGIGRESAILLARSGCELVLAGRRASALEEVASACRSEGVVVGHAVGDLASAEYVRELVAQARGMRGAAEPVLVHAAGSAEFGSFAEMSPGAIDHQIESNLTGPIRLTQGMIPWMLESGGGRVVSVLSVAAVHAFPGAEAYCAAKAGMLMFGRSLAAEYRSAGIRVSALLPGSVDSPLWEGKGFVPPREDMLPASAVAEAVRDLVMSPVDRVVEELRLMPPKGIL